MDILPQLLLVFVLVLLNGYFVASEFALVAVRKTRIEELVRKKNRAAILVQGALKDLDSYISATQLGITIASLALGWVGEPVIATFIQQYLTFLPDTSAWFSSHTIAFILAFSIITFLHIVLGELAPKSIALQRSEVVSLVVITPLIAFAKIFRPFIVVLNGTGNLVLKAFGVSAPAGHQLVHSEEEIKMILRLSEEQGAIKEKEAEMVYNVFKLGDTPVKQIMVPRTDIVAFSVSTTLSDIVKQIEKNLHSRFPVYEHSIDSIIGFIHVKDIYKEAMKNGEKKRLSQTDLLREIIHLPETKRADEALLDMRRKRTHLAVVNDEYGGTAGIITLEDIIESVVGEIQDEFEKPIKEFRKMPDGSYSVDGLTSVERIQQKFNVVIKGQAYTTIGGLVFGLLGREPHAGDEVQIGDIVFKIEKMEKNRIKSLLIRKEKRKKKLS